MYEKLVLLIKLYKRLILKRQGKLTQVEQMARAIEHHEGFFVGSRSYRNNNPGNIKFAGQYKAMGTDDKGFAIFDTYADGYNALIKLIENACDGKSITYRPSMTLYDFFGKYAPQSDNNDSEAYAVAVASEMKLSPYQVIGELT